MLPNFFYIKKHASYSYVDMYIVLGISTFHFNPFLIADDNKRGLEVHIKILSKLLSLIVG